MDPKIRQGKFAKLLEVFSTKTPMFPNDFGVVAKVHTTASVSQALAKMFEMHVQTLPVVDEKGHLAGLFYATDVVHWISVNFTDEELNAFSKESIEKEQKLKKMSVMELVESYRGREEMNVVTDEQTLLDAAEQMVVNKAHRIVVVDKDNYPMNLITQSRLLKLVDVVLDGIPVAHRTLTQLSMDQSEVFTITDDKRVRDAFQLISDKKVNAVAVVDSKGKLLGSISATDLRQLGYDFRFFGLLNGSCGAFLERVRVYDAQRTIAPKDDPVTVKSTARLGDVVKKMNYHNIHRVFVVDNDFKPCAVVSMTDVLATIMKNEVDDVDS